MLKISIAALLALPFLLRGENQAQEAETRTSSHTRMVEALRWVEENSSNLPFVSNERIFEIQTYLDQNAQSIDDEEFFNALRLLSSAQLEQGQIRVAIENLDHALDLARSAAGSEFAVSLVHLEKAQIYLRMAETENCCSRYTSESCILPLQGSAIHTKPEYSRKAIALFEKGLQPGISNPSLRDKHFYKSLWLLNLAYMTLGEYPDKVPPPYRLPESILESEVDFPRFENVSASLGLARESLAGGVIADDFDGDSDIDIAVSSWEPSGKMAIYENLGSDQFRDRTAEAGVEGIIGGINMVQADYDNDGDVDIFIPRGGWMGEHGKHPNSLLRNDGSGHFEDVTFDAGLADVSYPTQTAAWADYDLDGHLDLYVGNETMSISAPSQLFRNLGNGTFEDVAVAAGVTNNQFTKGAVWTDVNNDRYPDLIVSNLTTENRLYINLGDGTFEDRAVTAGISQPAFSFPLWSWDVDNDGNRDIFINSYTGKTHIQAMRSLGLQTTAAPAALYRGDGSGQFKDVSQEFALDFPTLTMGCNIGDINNDGFTDCYLGTGDPNLMSIVPNRLFINSEGKRFIDVTMASGMGHLQKGHGVAFADFDSDGDLDIFEQLGGAVTIDKYRDAYFRNPGFAGAWIQIKAIGATSNRSAIGTRIRVRVATPRGARDIHGEINSGGSFGSNPLVQHIGLGDARRILELELFWPASGERQIFKDVPLRKWIAATEGKSDIVFRDGASEKR